jgi:hypothetical protein
MYCYILTIIVFILARLGYMKKKENKTGHKSIYIEYVY